MKVLKRLLRFAAPYWNRYLVATVLVFAISALNLLEPMVIKWVIDEILESKNYSLLLYGALAILGVAILRGVLQFFQRFTMSWAGQKVVFDIRNTLYRHLQQLSFSFYDKAQTGQIMSRVTSDVETAQRFLSNGLVNLVSIVLTFTTTLIIMLSHHTKLTLMAMITVPFLAWRVQVYSTQIRPMFWSIQQQLAVLTARLQENITGQRVVKAFARKDHELEVFERDNMALLERNVRAERLSGVNWALMRLLTEISLGIILWYGGYQVIRGNITYGTLVAFNMWLGRLLGPIRRLGFWVSMVQRTVASGERIFEILDTKAEVQDKPGAKPMPPIEGRVTFENVSFSYDGEHMVIDDINLDVKPGQTIAILGGTGSGKST